MLPRQKYLLRTFVARLEVARLETAGRAQARQFDRTKKAREAILGMLAELLAVDVTPEVGSAWTELLNRVAATMMAAVEGTVLSGGGRN